MNNKALALGIAGAAAAAVILALGFVAGRSAGPTVASAPPVDQAQVERMQIEAVVRDYLLTNPELLTEMQLALEQSEREEQRLAQVETISASADDIFNGQYDGVIGNPEGNVTVVEFFDYNCGFCKRAYEDMEAMVEADPDLRFVLKEFPILGPESQQAHVVSMAFSTLAPELYPEFHRDLLMSGGRANEAAAIRAAVALGVDEAALREEMQNPAISDAIGRNYELATQLSISGTPSYVIGTEVVFGALGQAVLEQKVELARAAAD